MEKKEHIYDDMGTDRGSVVSSFSDVDLTIKQETSLYDDGIAFIQENLTVSNKGTLGYIRNSLSNEETINYNKPWRKVIRRGVIDVGNDNES